MQAGTTQGQTPRTFIEDHRGWLTVFGGRSLAAVLLFAAGLEAGLIALGRGGGHCAFGTAGFVLAGVVYWTFMEYALHRWFYHFRPRHRALRRLVESFHVYHHRHIDDRAVWNAGPALVVLLTLALSVPPLLVLRDVSQAALVMAGAVPAYAVYEIAHHQCHARVHTRGVRAFLQSFHLRHHERDWRRNFGVTNPFWDWALGTLAPRDER